MAEVLSLPPELLEFIRTAPPQSLLIRGPPGTGKTMLALELLKAYTGSGIYVSGRVAVPNLRRAFPWLAAPGSSIRTVDSSRRGVGVRTTSEMMRFARRMVAEPEASEEIRSLWLPFSIVEEWSRIGPDAPAMMVIDSWDALIEQYLGPTPVADSALPDRGEVERILLDLMGRAPVLLVLVTESREASQLDYLVNGVVSTRWERVGSRRERWLSLEKLRGVRIDNPEYPFTLEAAHFTCITSSPPAYLPKATHFAEMPEPVAGRIWPGNSAFQEAFGDLPTPGVSLFELSGAVPYDAIRVIHGPIQTGVVYRGGRVIHILPPGVSPRSLFDLYRSVFDAHQVERSVRISTATATDSEEVRRLVLPLPNPHSEPLAPRFEDAWKFIGETPPGGPRLAIVWLSGVQALASAQGFRYDPLVFPALTTNIVEGSRVHFLYIGESEDLLTRRLAPIASRHIRFVQRYDRTFLEGINPQTPEFVLAEGDPQLPYRLVRVV